jgi:hypothetical protein
VGASVLAHGAFCFENSSVAHYIGAFILDVLSLCPFSLSLIFNILTKLREKLIALFGLQSVPWSHTNSECVLSPGSKVVYFLETLFSREPGIPVIQI